MAIAPLWIGLLADEFPEVEQKISALRRFADLYRQRKPRRAETQWTAPALRLRNTLIALDGRLAGASYREIAEVIHGANFVRERWGAGRRNLKDQMIRAARRGETLMKGDYSRLLA